MNNVNHDMEALISIIVPVYNVELYIERCIKSIINQSYKNIEILLIDDGSKDKSGEICEYYQTLDPRIRVFHKPNGGLSSARNYGLDHCRGEYISFVDSDDWIEEIFIETLLKLLVDNNAQVASCNINIVDNDHIIRQWQKYSDEVEIYDNDKLMYVLATDYISTSSCNKLFKRELFEKIRYVEGLLYEDVELMHRCFQRVSKSLFTHVALYNYFSNDEGITRSTFSKKSFDFVEVSEKRLMFYMQYYPQHVNELYKRHVEICFNTLERSVFRNEYKFERVKVKYKIEKCMDEVPGLSVYLKYRIKRTLLLCGFPFFDSVIYLYQRIIRIRYGVK